METLLWFCLLACLVTLLLRWLLQRGTAPISPQMVRQLFTEHLLATMPHCRVLEDDDGAVTVHCGEARCTCDLTALHRRCLDAPFHAILLVRSAVTAVQAALEAPDALPADWADRVMPLLVSTALAMPPEVVQHPFLETLAVGYVLDGDEVFHWLTRGELETLGVTEDTLHELAMRNLERSCNTLVIETPPPLPDGNDRLLRFHTGDGLDATRVLLPSFYRRFSPRFGDVDLVVAIPTRDTCIVIPATDQAQASFLAWRAETEHRRSARPLSDVLLLVRDAGITAWYPGATPVEAE